MGAIEGLTFGPPLIINGQKVIKSGDGGWGISPRSAIGQKKDGTILFLVIDGRQPGYSIGATLVDSQNILYEMVLILQPTWTEAPPPPCTITAR